MKRCDKIYAHPLYKEHMEIIRKAEKDRKFCLHDLAHAMDVARIGRIIIAERHLDIDTELFYAAALLHDAARYCGKPHNISGAELAARIMPDCGFSSDETSSVCNAIRCHRRDGGANEFSKVLYEADKRSRMCFDCTAADECYWEEEKRNLTIDI